VQRLVKRGVGGFGKRQKAQPLRKGSQTITWIMIMTMTIIVIKLVKTPLNA